MVHECYDVYDVYLETNKWTFISGVVVVSWYPAGYADNEGQEPDSLMPIILDHAQKYELKVGQHLL